MGVVAEVERELARRRCEQRGDGLAVRTSTMTHLVWAPPKWLSRAREVLANLEERYPARAIFLVPEPGRRGGVEADARLTESRVHGLSRAVVSEVIELRLRGNVARHPASIVLPLLLFDLPVFCRWRGEPAWGASQLDEIVAICDRLVVDSGEWSGLPGKYTQLAGLFERTAVSDVAWTRTLAWRGRLAERWPEIKRARRLRVEGPRADSLLLAGWLRSRLHGDVSLSRREAESVVAVAVDGEPVEPPFAPPPSPSELLSAQLDVYSRDPVYEAAVRAA